MITFPVFTGANKSIFLCNWVAKVKSRLNNLPADLPAGGWKGRSALSVAENQNEKSLTIRANPLVNHVYA